MRPRSSAPPHPSPARRRLSEADAIDIWIARWLRIRRKDLIDRYGCDPRRLYEIWEGKRFRASREKALAQFAQQHPGLAERVDFGLHRPIPRAAPTEADGQLDLFERSGSEQT
ncbi:MAG: hypothetical protein J2P50_12115 [Hyphomicrobiaceae bacterium]|nr:hypothetical protein [Hyphomicrobiaceae bacterium]